MIAHTPHSSRATPAILLQPFLTRWLHDDAVRGAFERWTRTESGGTGIGDLFGAENAPTTARLRTIAHDDVEPHHRTCRILGRLEREPQTIHHVRAAHPWVTLYGPGVHALEPERRRRKPLTCAEFVAREERRAGVQWCGDAPRPGRPEFVSVPTAMVALRSALDTAVPDARPARKDAFVAAPLNDLEGTEVTAATVRKAWDRWQKLLIERDIGPVLIHDPDPQSATTVKSLGPGYRRARGRLVQWLRGRNVLVMLAAIGGRDAGQWDLIVSGTLIKTDIPRSIGLFRRMRHQAFVHGTDSRRRFVVSEFGPWTLKGSIAAIGQYRIKVAFYTPQTETALLKVWHIPGT